MIEVLKVFYPYHYNIGILSALLVMLLIFLLTKKNYKWSIITLIIVVALNIAVYKRTEGRSWTITLEPEKTSDPFVTPEVKKMTFSVHKDWTITDEKGEVHHWCWVEEYMQEFASVDLVAALCGENSSKKLVQASESHVNNGTE